VADDINEDLRSNLSKGPFHSVIFATELECFQDRGWLFSHSIVELCTAVKPAAALSLLDRSDCDTLLYFDPDIVLFSDLPDLLDELRDASLALTPHILKPETEHGAILDNEVCSLKHGIFNLGFFGVRDCSESRRFLNWWHDRMIFYCRQDLESGSFTDQKWINHAPVFFDDVKILKNPRFNVAPWNISQRKVSGTFDAGFSVDGGKLGFYHFTGFDSGAHKAMAGKYAPDNLSIKMLIEWYEARTNHLNTEKPPWKLGFYDNGEPIQAEHRLMYRFREDLKQAFRNPYLTDDGGRSFLAWYQSNVPAERP
jgi:hypothetical protein